MIQNDSEPVKTEQWLSDDESFNLSQSDASPPTQALLIALKKKSDKLTRKLHTAPQRNNKDLKKDIVYQLGELGTIEWVFGLVKGAKLKAAGKE